MSQLLDLPVDLVLYDTVKHGGAVLRNVRQQLGETWRRSIRSVGGYWLGTAQYKGSLFEMRDLFLGGLGREIRETLGGVITWQGLLVKADLTIGGLTYTRQWTDLANRVQVIYARLGDNLLSNGSVESGIWAAYGSPTVLAQSSAWVSDGANSAHIIANANNGALIQSGITIVASQGYDVQVSVKIVGGTWKLEIYRTDTNASLGSSSQNTAGQQVMRASISNTSTYAGAIGLRLYSQSAAAEIYADGAALRTSPVQARTAWYADALPQTDYGTLELALLQSSMSDDTANAHAQTALAEHKWPRTVPPDLYSGQAMASPASVGSLQLTFGGYAWSLRNKYVSAARAGTTQNASVHVTNLVGDSEFVTAGKIQANTMQYQIDDRAPLRVWKVLAALTAAGDTAGARWTCGVYANRLLQYLPASTTADYHYRSGQLLSLANTPVEPWLALPGLVYMDDMPAGPGGLSGNSADDPHVLFMEEVEFDAASYLAGTGGLAFRRLAGSDQAAAGA